LNVSAKSSGSCTCEDPIPMERAVRKGVAQTICARCGGAIVLRLAGIRPAA
jgi:hypothetical protein